VDDGTFEAACREAQRIGEQAEHARREAASGVRGIGAALALPLRQDDRTAGMPQRARATAGHVTARGSGSAVSTARRGVPSYAGAAAAVVQLDSIAQSIGAAIGQPVTAAAVYHGPAGDVVSVWPGAPGPPQGILAKLKALRRRLRPR
jgi:hypothetical protein